MDGGELVQVFFGGIAGLVAAYLLVVYMGICFGSAGYRIGFWGLAFGAPMVNKNAPPFVRGIGYMFLLLLTGALLLFLVSRV